MEKPQLENSVKLFLKGQLSKVEEKELLEWINISPDNKKYFYSLQEIFNEELKSETDESTSIRWEQFIHHVKPASKIEKYYKFAIPIAAAFILGFFISTLVFLHKGKKFGSTVVEQQITTPYGARIQFMLPDSSMVWLNSGSELQFPSTFENNREVTLVGEAYFEVKKSKIPLVVSTNFGDVQVKGTSFNVQAYNDDLFETTLVTGKVHLLAANNDKVELNPGDKAVYTGDEIKIDQVETALYTSWTQGKLIFHEEYLPQLVKKLERWYNVKIELEKDPRLDKINFTGTIEMETFSEVLNLLSVTAPVDYTWDDKTRVIKLFYKKPNKN